MRIVKFSKGFIPAAVISIILIIAGIAGFIVHRGFNLGVDFQAGLIQEVQFAPTALGFTYSGRGSATVSMDRTHLYIVVSGVGLEGVTHSFSFAEYPTIGALLGGLSTVEGLGVTRDVPEDALSTWLVQSARGDPQLGSEPFRVHYLPANSPVIGIEEVRTSLLPLGTVSVQALGLPEERRFMIRLEDDETNGGDGGPVIAALESAFGAGGVAVTRADYVGSRFSKSLTDQAGLLLGLTLLLILLYASIRFKLQYAIGAVLAIAHDALIMVAFITWTRMEFNTTTIAAILTILGYSINDTIVIFDRIRENQRIYPNEPFVETLDRSVSETLSRTVITTVTTMLAVLCLYIFTSGSMKDFALALLVGMVSGVYSTIFIATGFLQLWNERIAKRRIGKRKALGATA